MEPLPTYRIVLPIVVVIGLSVFCYFRNVPRFRAMLLGIVAFSLYGMLQDQVSTRLCPEYFTVMHPPIPGLVDPTLMGITWGFLGSWWGGAIAGYIAGLCATSGTKHPPLPVRAIVWPMFLLIVAMGIITLIVGITVWRHTDLFEVQFGSWFAHVVPPERQRGAFIVACYHFSAYSTAIIGSIAMCMGIGMYRVKRSGKV